MEVFDTRRLLMVFVAFIFLVSCTRNEGFLDSTDDVLQATLESRLSTPSPKVENNEMIQSANADLFETVDVFFMATAHGMLDIKLLSRKESKEVILVAEDASGDELNVRFLLTGISFAMHADLDYDDYEEVIVFNGYDGSNYGAGNLHVFKVTDDGFIEVLTILNQPTENEELVLRYSSSLFIIHDYNGVLHDDNRANYVAYCTTFPQIIEDGDEVYLRVNHNEGKAIKGTPYSDIGWNGKSYEVIKQGFFTK